MPTAFDRLLGETQGRIAPVNASPPAGEFVFALGSDARGAKFPLNLGDFVRVEQTADVTGLKLVRFQAILRPPETVPAGTRWVLEWGVNASVQGRRVIVLGQTLHLRDGAINVTSLTGDQTIFLRLRFIGADGFPPEILSVTPSSGTWGGGDAVTITGSGFTGATGADFGGTPLASFKVVNDTTITGTTCAHPPPEVVDVRVSHPNGDAWLVDGWEYTLAIPEDRYMELAFVSAPQSTSTATPGEVIGARAIDTSILPTEPKHYFFVATLSSSDTTPVAHVELWDVTHNVMVTSASLDNSAAGSKLANQTFTSAELTAGSASGNIRTDAPAEYEVRLYRAGGLGTDLAICANAYVRIVFD